MAASETGGLVFLTGGTGTVGRRIAALLQASNIPCAVASRSGAAPPGLTGVRFDWADRSMWEPALTTAAAAAENSNSSSSSTVRAVYLVTPGIMDPGPTAAAFVDLARGKFGARRFVLLSATAIEEGGPATGQVHAALRERGDKGEIEWAVLRPSWFQDNFATQENHLRSIREESRIYSATGAGRLPFVSARDVAAVAAAALTTLRPPRNRELLVLGPELLSYGDVAAALSRVLGRAIAHADLAEGELARRHRRVSGVPEAYAAVLAAMDTAVRNGAEERLGGGGGGDVLQVTGRPPGRFAEFVEENRDVWA